MSEPTEQEKYLQHVRTCIEQYEGDTDAGYDYAPQALEMGTIVMTMHPMLAASIVMGCVEDA